MLVLRTNRRFWRSRPGRALLGTSIAVAAITLALPYSTLISSVTMKPIGMRNTANAMTVSIFARRPPQYALYAHPATSAGGRRGTTVTNLRGQRHQPSRASCNSSHPSAGTCGTDCPIEMWALLAERDVEVDHVTVYWTNSSRRPPATEPYANNRTEADHVVTARLWLGPGLTRFRSAVVIAAGHVLVQNVAGFEQQRDVPQSLLEPRPEATAHELTGPPERCLRWQAISSPGTWMR